MKKYKALKVTQPFGDFFVISMKARDILEVTFSDVLRYDEDKNLKGSQRKLDLEKRVREIKDYINTDELAFPNSIILACNYNEQGFIEEDEQIRWKIKYDKQCEIYEVEIPTNNRLAAIIDGQHRVNGFENSNDDRKDTELIICLYFDLPSPYQAYLFAKINSNQKPVDKSLALEQFGYMANLIPPEKWSPELLSVYFTRRLNLDKESAFYNHIKVTPQNIENLLEILPKERDWLVSTSTVVDGILKLITTNPKRDSNLLGNYDIENRKRALLPDDGSPLRSFYLQGNDLFIYKTVFNFFNAVNRIFFEENNYTFIKKTTGIQALFNVLRILLSQRLQVDKDISENYFFNYLNRAKNIDFSDNFFTASSGIGKSRIQNIILLKLELKNRDTLKEEQLEDYLRLLKD